MDEFFRGPRLPGENEVLFDKMDLYVQAVDCDSILKISVKPVRFLDQNDPTTRVAAQERDHLTEAASAASLGRFHVGEFLGDGDYRLGCVVPE